MIRRLEDDLRRRTRRLLDAVEDGGRSTSCVDVAAELPMQMICVLLGMPEGDRHWLFEAVEPTFDFRGDRQAVRARPTTADAARLQMFEYGNELIAAKRADPGDDMLSVVVHAELDGRRAAALTDLELYAFFSLLFSAGAETTRNAIAGGLLALVEHPDQMAALRADPSLLATAIEEIVRWTTPSPVEAAHRHPRRRAARRRPIAPGDKVVVWEGSANRDERASSTDPAGSTSAATQPARRLRPRHPLLPGRQPGPARDPGPVRGAAAALRRVELVEPVEWTRSNRHTGIRRLTVALGRA